MQIHASQGLLDACTELAYTAIYQQWVDYLGELTVDFYLANLFDEWALDLADLAPAEQNALVDAVFDRLTDDRD